MSGESDPDLTLEQMSPQYVADKGGSCPLCGDTAKLRRLGFSMEVFFDGCESTGNATPHIKVFRTCMACFEDWWEIYTLTGVEAT